MRTLTSADFEGINRTYSYSLMVVAVDHMIDGCEFEIKSDFSGNLFYSYRENDCIHTKPLNICIPELKCEHDEMADQQLDKCEEVGE